MQGLTQGGGGGFKVWFNPLPSLAVNQTNSPYPKPLIHSNNKVKIE